MKFSRVNKHNQNKGGLWIALIFLFVGSAKAQSSYPINDPRNPDCPCHKYQKLADEEFKKLLTQNKTVNDQKTKPVELLASNKHIGISDDAMGKLNKINDDKHIGISDDAMGKLNKTNEDKLPTDMGINADDKEKNKVFIPNDTDHGIGNINEKNRDWSVNEQKITRSGSKIRSPQYITSKHWKVKRKKHSAFYKQMKRIFYVGGWDIWKGKRITSACYHWR